MGKALQSRRRIDVLLMRFGSNTNALWNDLLQRLAASTCCIDLLSPTTDYTNVNGRQRVDSQST